MNVKSLLWLASLLLLGCASARTPVKVTDPAVIRARAQPVTIFGIGYWGKDYMILTLVDARYGYLTVTIRRDNTLKRAIYSP